MFKNSKLFGIKLIIFMIFFMPSLYAVELNWLHDHDKALVQAKKEHKGVYLFIGADTCKYCDMFKENTLSDKALIKQLKKDYVPLYLSRDRHQIPDGFQTKGAPIHYFLTEDGKVIYQTWGILDITGFYDLLEDADLNAKD